MALDLPEAVRVSLVAWQGAALAGRAGLRTLGSESLHVTLCFLGEQEASALPQIISACEALAGTPVRSLALGAAVWLPRRRPRVLAVAIEDDDGEMRDAQAHLTAELVRAGALQPEGRLFFPHVTVARVRSGARVRAATLRPPDPHEFAAESVILYRSHLGGGPARYETVHRVALQAA